MRCLGGAISSQMQRLLRGYRSGNEGEVMVPFSASIVPPQASGGGGGGVVIEAAGKTDWT